VAPEDPLPPMVLSRLEQFTSMVKLKRVAMMVIAEGLKEEEIAGLREMFQMMDTDGSGTITVQELQEGAAEDWGAPGRERDREDHGRGKPGAHPGQGARSRGRGA